MDGLVKSQRPTIDEYFLRMAKLVATRATCRRRSVGCILVNERNHVLATGYNGNATGMPHCLNEPCPGADQKSGQGLELCEATHAEQNSLLQCRDVYQIARAYCTISPCVHCVKLLLNTSCQEIVFAHDYAHSHTVVSKELWHRAGREWRWLMIERT
jgi:dCMP deaminase